MKRLLLCGFFVFAVFKDKAHAGDLQLEKMGLLIAVKDYQEKSESQKMGVLRQLSLYFKDNERILYNRIYQEMHALDSLTKNSLTFIKKKNCRTLSSTSPSSLDEFRCKNLVSNALKRYGLVENEIETNLLPLMNEFELEATKTVGKMGSRTFAPLKDVLTDLKRRIIQFKKVEGYYREGNFKAADNEVKKVLPLLGV